MDAFFKGVQNYLADPQLAFSYAKTPDLQKHLEAASDTSLDEFFKDWFYGEGYPEYTVVWSQNSSDQLSHFQVSQKQSHPSVSFFDMPLPITVMGTSGESEKLRLEVSEDNQVFSVQLDFTVASVKIDPDSHLISRNNQTVLGLDQESLENSLSIHPNPVDDEMIINSNGLLNVRKISIYNILGEKVFERSNPDKLIDLQKLDFGVHLVVIDTDQGRLNKTILKK